jgi:hypothetical protein
MLVTSKNVRALKAAASVPMSIPLVAVMLLVQLAVSHCVKMDREWK